jgi:acyl transferase domain-containing protein/pimeloyl-ACP methyl ester carboxylesterase
VEAIAIIGMGCRFPGANHPKAFWDLISQQVDAITEVPPERWDVEALYDPRGGYGKMNTRWGGFLDHIDRFDAEFFGIAPREAIYLDPQQRLLLEVTWEALENAGQAVEQLAGSQTGVFVGISCSDYHQRLRQSYNEINAYMATGNAFSIAANRLSYLFDFHGPSMAVDTACSSSLVAAHLACQSLLRGESNLALAAGVNLLLSPELTVILSQARMMSPDGRCKTFDAKANGYVRGEGCGVVVLKRLADALTDGDPILALIRGSAINQDGRSNGLTAPNGLAQVKLIRQALANAGVEPGQISYVEAHGTGTSLGDPIEVEALGTVLAAGREPDNPCVVGSVKTNIGHLEAAAGVAGLIKLVLMLTHRQIPPNLHFHTPNPYIPFAQLPLRVPQQLEDWTARVEPPLAGISSFGFGGANAHMILEAAPTLQRCPSRLPLEPPQARLLPLSARSPEALKALAQTYWFQLQAETLAPTATDLTDLCYTASVRRSHHAHRLSLAFETREQLLQSLAEFRSEGEPAGLLTRFSVGQKKPSRRSRLVFVCSGQGPQWWGMGRQLLVQEPVFRASLEACDAHLQNLAGWSLLAQFQVPEAQSRLDETAVAQPALFALQVALASLWRSWGIEPDAIVGHSVGEVAAVHIAGGLSLEDALQVVWQRGRLMQKATGQGKMAAVELTVAAAEQLLIPYQGRLAIAAINSPTSLVLSGETAALQEVLQALAAQQVFCKLLPVNYAFHSPQMAPYQAELAQALAGIQPQTPTVPIFSTVTGQQQVEQMFDPDYWARNIREPVRLATVLEHLVAHKHNLFVELSPHPVLAGYIAEALRQGSVEGVALPSLRRHENEKLTLLSSLGKLYTQGHPVDWQRLYAAGGTCVPLPTYPWQRKRYWLNEAQFPKTQPVAEAIGIGVGDHPENRDSDLKPELQPERVNVAAARVTRSQLLATPTDQRHPVLVNYLSALLAKVMGLSADKVDLEQPLYHLGLDSLMAVELIRQIEQDLEVKLPLEYFAGLSVAEFVTQLLLIVEGKLFAEPSAPEGLPQHGQGHLLEEENPKNNQDNRASTVQRWLPCPPNRQAHLRIFCFPYAGGGASIFRTWGDSLPAEIQVCPIQLPGREDRLGEAALTRLSTLIKTLLPLLKPELDVPFALFGHSLGGLVCFELVRELRKQGLPLPAHLLISGCRPPQTPDQNPPIHRLADHQFLEALHRLNGTPAEVLQNTELMQLLLPGLRADFALLETYFYATQPPLACPISVFGGLEDTQVTPDQLTGWQEQTEADFSLTLLPGDHFFLRQSKNELLSAIAQVIDQPVFS